LPVAPTATLEQHPFVVLWGVGEPWSGTDLLLQLQRVVEVPLGFGFVPTPPM
jgi:hypothetical protein